MMKEFEEIEWIFFDVGSTLVDEHFAYERRFRDIAQKAHISYEQVYSQVMELYRQNKKGDLEITKILGVEKPEWHSDDEILYGDVPEGLSYLSRKYKIGVIANQSMGTEARLAQHGILQYIDLVVASAEEGVSKPDPRIFWIALERSGCKPENAVMIGDRVDNDIVPAKRIGMKTIWMKQGYGQYWNISSKEEEADLVVSCMKEICKVLSY